MYQRESARVSGVTLFKKNLLDPVIPITVSATYLFCLYATRGASLTTFLVLFSCVYWFINNHIESYRSFKVTRRWIRKLEADDQLVQAFLEAHFPKDAHSDHKTGYASQSPRCQQPRLESSPRQDTYVWINKIITFFWPYLSHVVHHELNEFLRRSNTLARHEKGMRRLLYEFVRQIDANILSIEHCELGARAPYVKSLVAFSDGGRNKSLVYDLDLAYEGNMNILFICRYFCCCSSRMGLRDVFVHLKSRFVLGPIDDRGPTIEAFGLSLLELPTFGYKGIALVELAELKIAKRSINRLISEHLLYPKCLSVRVSDLDDNMRERQGENLKQQQQQRQDGAPSRLVSAASSANSDVFNSRPPLMTRLLGQLMYFGCICANCCLRGFCQHERKQRQPSPGQSGRTSIRN